MGALGSKRMLARVEVDENETLADLDAREHALRPQGAHELVGEARAVLERLVVRRAVPQHAVLLAREHALVGRVERSQKVLEVARRVAVAVARRHDHKRVVLRGERLQSYRCGVVARHKVLGLVEVGLGPAFAEALGVALGAAGLCAVYAYNFPHGRSRCKRVAAAVAGQAVVLLMCSLLLMSRRRASKRRSV